MTDDGTYAQWKSQGWHYRWEDDPIETTAYALRFERAGTGALTPGGNNWHVGDRVDVDVTVTAVAETQYVAIDDPLPAGLEFQPMYGPSSAARGLRRG